ncbi:helix-turn-helix domain-containing protein [Pedobacter hiemivivus]|uniref:Helix-turn-helix domain-containing protein n=1 Tax=Pedobacter hiemivivus TaxID=2530454 RepID=A0A4U1G585_9SPHI|nr:helix-turn-helix domain-containing protein [Pedobacter hiemivivus]TKC57623.1 helix-turn-helix domain-containing protein [Pedobacter hiemivivus]
MSYTNTKTLRFEEAERNPLVLIDMATLKSMLDNVIGNALQKVNFKGADLKNGESLNENPDLMDMEEALKFLKVSKVTIHNWKKKGIIKSHKMGRKLYFKRSELLEAIKRQKYSLNII